MVSAKTVSLPGTGLSYAKRSTLRSARGSGLRFLALLRILVALIDAAAFAVK
jgi:hypothetical protein